MKIVKLPKREYYWVSSMLNVMKRNNTSKLELVWKSVYQFLSKQECENHTGQSFWYSYITAKEIFNSRLSLQRDDKLPSPFRKYISTN